MEENIKILENDINYNKRQMEEKGSYIPFDIKLMERVENLIKELKDSDDLLISIALELRQNEEYIRELEEDNQKFESGKFLTPAQCVRIGKDYIPKSKVKEIVDECIPRGKNIITGEEEYKPNTNANSFLTQRILELMEEK